MQALSPLIIYPEYTEEERGSVIVNLSYRVRIR